MPARSAKTVGRGIKSTGLRAEPRSDALPASEPGDILERNDTSKQPRKGRKEDKVVRDSFTMPAHEYELIGKLKKRCLALGVAIKKSELLRAGLAMLDELPDRGLTEAVTAVVSVRTGRPPGKKEKKRG
jgi:hypothetical protein